MNLNFNQLPLKKELLDNLAELNFNSMTPIQAKSLPEILEKKDIIAQAKTGSGKTAAFGLAILNSLNISNNQTQALILCPTRELAEQVANELRMLARLLKNLKVVSICGGMSETLQEKSLRSGAHIIVGTPGRVLSLLKKDSINLSSLDFFTLDEADRMLDMGFYSAIQDIVEFLPRKRQSLLFSATYPDKIKDLGREIQTNAIEVRVDVSHDIDNIKQIFYEIPPSKDKNNFLYKILCAYRPERLIVFCKTKKETNDVAHFLENRNIYVQSLNGDIEQSERTEILTKFSNNSLSVLVATDVAARGLDIEGLAAIINYNLPTSPEGYIHRIGRTGRAGKKGLAFSFVDSSEQETLKKIENLTSSPCQLEDISKVSYSQKYDLVPPMKTMYISGGKKDKLRPGDIVGALVGVAKLNANDIGDISIHSIFSFVAIKSEHIQQAIKRLSGAKIKKKKFKVGLA